MQASVYRNTVFPAIVITPSQYGVLLKCPGGATSTQCQEFFDLESGAPITLPRGGAASQRTSVVVWTQNPYRDDDLDGVPNIGESGGCAAPGLALVGFAGAGLNGCAE